MQPSRRRFDHLVVELSLAASAPLPRYALWLRLHQLQLDPERLGRRDALWFCRGPAEDFLAEHGHVLGARARRRLLREVGRYDPSQRTPEERMADFGRPARG